MPGKEGWGGDRGGSVELSKVPEPEEMGNPEMQMPTGRAQGMWRRGYSAHDLGPLAEILINSIYSRDSVPQLYFNTLETTCRQTYINPTKRS